MSYRNLYIVVEPSELTLFFNSEFAKKYGGNKGCPIKPVILKDAGEGIFYDNKVYQVTHSAGLSDYFLSYQNALNHAAKNDGLVQIHKVWKYDDCDRCVVFEKNYEDWDE